MWPHDPGWGFKSQQGWGNFLIFKNYLCNLPIGKNFNEKLPSPVKGLPICSSLWMLQETHLYWHIYVFVSFDCSIPLLGLISTGSEKWALFWRFRAEPLIFCWDIYVFVSFNRSIPLLGLILTGLEKWALFWRFHAELLISCWDNYVFVSFDHSIPLLRLISTNLEKRALFWRFHAELLIFCWDI